jgi:arylsulfatase A-like enzyme
LHEDELAIPLALKLLGVVGPKGGISCLTGLVDLLPTLCSYLGLACPEGLEGRDLLAPRATRRYLVSEATGVAPRHRSIRNEEWKLIWQPDGAPEGKRANPYSLYEIAVDPGERRDLIDTPDPELRAVAERLEAELQAAGPVLPLHTAPNVQIDKPVQERLRQLGYVE